MLFRSGVSPPELAWHLPNHCRALSPWKRHCSGFVRCATVVALLGAAGCTVGPDFQKPSLWSPASWFRASSPSAQEAARHDPTTAMVAAPANPAWWDAFRDPVLSRLVRQVATSNLDVRTATVRLAESRAQLRITAADEYPQVNGNGSYTRERVSPRGVVGLFGGGSSGGSSGSAGGGGGSMALQSNGLGGRQSGIPTNIGGSSAIPPFNLFQYGFDASWELDVWGKVRRAIEQAHAQVEVFGRSPPEHAGLDDG